MDYTLEDTHLSEMPASLQRIPIFVRGGTVLPLEEQGRLVLHLYPDSDGNASGQVYSDAGDLEDGEERFRVESFDLSLEGDSYVLVRHSIGDYPFPWEGIEVKMHCSELPVRLEQSAS